MISILFVLIFAFVATGIGWLVVDRFDRARNLTSIERLSVGFVTGFVAIYFGVFVVGAFRLDQVSMGALFVGLALFAVSGLIKMPWREFSASIQSEISEISDNRWTALSWAILLAIVVTSLVQALAPPNDFDSLTYHLAAPQFDLESGFIGVAVKTESFGSFHPALGSNITRLSLSLMNDGAAQMIHGLFGVLAAMAAAALVFRLGYNKQTALLAAILFVSVRMVIWQMATVEVDVPMGAIAVLSLVIYLASRDTHSVGIEVLFGLTLGATILMKYHGFVTALSITPLLVYDVVVRRKSLQMMIIAPIIALATITPHLLRNSKLTGNPVYPLYNKIFNPGMPDWFAGVHESLGTGRGVIDFLTLPWNISILPTHYFDGMMLGAPYLLALCPLILFDKNILRKWGPAFSYVFMYFVLWFLFLSHQARFLTPILPVLAAIAAVGIISYWHQIKNAALLRVAFVGLLGVLAVNQSLFIGIYSILRLPVAVGLISPTVYHEKTPAMNGASYTTCKYISDNLKDGDRYFSLAYFISYYCPQKPVNHEFFDDEEGWWIKTKIRPEMSIEQFLFRLNKENYRFFLVQWLKDSRGRTNSRSEVQEYGLSQRRFGTFLKRAFDQLEPVKRDAFTAVYDGKAVLDILNNQATR